MLTVSGVRRPTAHYSFAYHLPDLDGDLNSRLSPLAGTMAPVLGRNSPIRGATVQSSLRVNFQVARWPERDRDRLAEYLVVENGAFLRPLVAVALFQEEIARVHLLNIAEMAVALQSTTRLDVEVLLNGNLVDHPQLEGDLPEQSGVTSLLAPQNGFHLVPGHGTDPD
jgi:hypothetical protein